MQSLRIGRREVQITRPDKVLFPDDGITKRGLVDYYRRVSRWMLPHLRGRPLMLERYPDGLGKRPLIQKAASSYFPDWIHRVTVPKTGGTVEHVICDDEATLAYLANQACITPHTWLSCADRLDAPDQMVLDLDPSGADFGAVKDTARTLRDLLDDLRLPAFLKTSGSRGLHIVVPLRRDAGFDASRSLALQLARLAVADSPQTRTLEFHKARRGDRIFLDVNRNQWAQNVAPAYAVRPRPGAPVSMPIDWSELDDAALRPDGFTVANAFERLDRTENPWKDFRRRAVSLRSALRRFEASHAA